MVPEPTCGYVLKKDYVDYVGGPDARLVASHTYDACEYLMKLQKGDGTILDTDFGGDIPSSVAYHTPCHLRAQNIGLKSRDLMKLTGTKVTLVQQCSGIDGLWGLRAENAELSLAVGKKLAAEIERVGADTVAGDCHLANGVIVEQTGRVPLHPIQVVARAYGIDPSRCDRKLTVADISTCAYERERPALLRHVMDLKSRRRAGVGPIVTFVFENRDTIRFQVQEMARVEKLITDESILTELETYNPLIPERCQLSATLFVELTTADDCANGCPAGRHRAGRPAPAHRRNRCVRPGRTAARRAPHA